MLFFFFFEVRIGKRGKYKLSEWQLGTPDLVFFFDCKKSTALERYLTRKLEGRLDDTEQMFHRRYNEFERCNPAVVEYYYRRGLLLHVSFYYPLSMIGF